MKNFSKQANFFKGICKKALLMISKFIDLGSLMYAVAIQTLVCCADELRTNALRNVNTSTIEPPAPSGNDNNKKKKKKPTAPTKHTDFLSKAQYDALSPAEKRAL